MRIRLVVAVALLIAGCNNTRHDTTLDAEAKWVDASRGFTADVRTFMVKYRVASEDEQRRMLAAHDEPRHRWTPRMNELALRFKGDCAAVRFDRWLLLNAVADPQLADRAAARIVANAACGGVAMQKAVATLGVSAARLGKERTLDNLRAIARLSIDPAVREAARAQGSRLIEPPQEFLHDGASPPALRGVDANGVVVDLANYRGKVTVVDFWGAWCGPCVARIPAMKKLAAEFRQSPFVIIGVNSDRDRDVALEVMRAQGVTWPNVMDGQTAGPIATAWRVTHWPSIVVLGRDGRIAAIEPGDAELVSIVRHLLKDGRNAV
jgi:thiol-disulfide isomerase/thioredoxin